MASNYLSIEKNLIKAVIAADSITPTEFPGMVLKKTPDSLWLKVHNLRGESSPVTLGDKGEDHHPGILQIDINYPANKGTSDVLQKADELTRFFTAGKRLLYTTQEVVVQASSVTQGRQVGGYYRVSVTVIYYARTSREA